MSLDYDLTKVPDDVRLVEDPETGKKVMSPITNALIWNTMGIGIGTITEDNWEEVWHRTSFAEKVRGASLVNSEGPRPLTAKDIHDHIGLSTNVFPKETEAKWLKRLFKGNIQWTSQRAVTELKRELEES